MGTVEHDGIQSIRKDVLIIHDAILSIMARLDSLSPQDDAGNNPSVAVLSAEDVEQQQKIIESGDWFDVYKFARTTPGADIQALQQVLLDHGEAVYAYVFARDIDGADIKALQQAVIERGDGWDLYNFAKYIHGADLPSLHKRLVELHSTGSDTNSSASDDRNSYLDVFNRDQGIQAELKEQLTNEHSEHTGNTSSNKHRPS